MKKIIILLGITLSVFSCHKEENRACEPLKTVENTLANLDYDLRKPSFNPLNSDELVFVYFNQEQSKTQLIKYNWKAKKSSVLAEGFTDLSTFGNTSWGKDGWIAFVDHNRNVIDEFAVVHAEGSDVRYFNRGGRGLQFGANGLLCFLHWGKSEELQSKYILYALDLNRNSVDTVAFFVDENGLASYMQFALSKEEKFTGLGVFNVALGSSPLNLSPLVSNEMSAVATPYSYAYSRDGNYVYFTQGSFGKSADLYRINVHSKVTEVVRIGCESTRLGQLNISEDNRYLAVELLTLYQTNMSSDGYKSQILIIDLVTKEEHIIIM